MGIKARPLQDRILVKRTEEGETIKGGIVIPEVAKEKPQEGEVVAVGPGKPEQGVMVPVGVKVGDHVLFGKYSGSDINIDGVAYLILREEELFAVLEE